MLRSNPALWCGERLKERDCEYVGRRPRGRPRTHFSSGLGRPQDPPGRAGGSGWGEGGLGFTTETASPTTSTRVSGPRQRYENDFTTYSGKYFVKPLMVNTLWLQVFDCRGITWQEVTEACFNLLTDHEFEESSWLIPEKQTKELTSELNFSWQTWHEMTCFFLGTMVTPNVCLMIAFCTGSIWRTQRSQRSSAFSQAWQSDQCWQWWVHSRVSVDHCDIPCWGLGKVRLELLSQQEMAEMVSSSPRNQWCLKDLAMLHPRHYIHFLEDKRKDSFWTSD